MKISNILTKVIAASATGVLLFTAVTGASTIKVPNMGSTSREYADMVAKSNVFGNISSVVVDAFTKQCITAAELDRAIQNANLAANTIPNLTFLDALNKPYAGPFSGTGTAANTHYVRDTGIANQVNGYLSNASLSPVTLTLKKSFVTANGVPRNEYYNKLALSITTPLYPSGQQRNLVNFGGANNVTPEQLSEVFSKYATFLTSVKAFYTAAGCYTVNTTQAPPNTTTNRPGWPSRPGWGGNTTQRPQTIRDAVINVRYKRVKLGSRFVIMDGVTARDNGGRGADLTNRVTVRGAINTSKLGSYRITYSVRGANGRTVTKAVTYQVVRSIFQGGRYYDKW